MADLIEPTHFDAVVISSGLPEVLIASALARAGKAVLVLDAEESYGSSWASLSGTDFVHNLLNNSLEGQHNEQQQRQAHAAAPHGTTADTPEPGDSAGRIAVQQQQQLAGVQGCSLYTHAGLEKALDNKGLIIDLAPRVLYQDEPLVHLLVSCQAHNYLEFKLVEGNYLYLDGRLLPVPASRADLFADRALSLADKRSLGRFMAACVEAAEGSGRLKDSFDSRPLVELLVSEGLNDRLQQVVLYGIAMANTPQHTAQQQTQQHAEQTAAENASVASILPGPQQQQQQLLTAADGLAAFVLYSQSLGRFGGSGALMAPCYGCGSLTDAFVRLAAVKGAVTALRHATTHLQLLPDAADDDVAGVDNAAIPAAEQTDTEQQQQQPSSAPETNAGGSEQQQQGIVSAAAAASSTAGPLATALPRVCLTLASGQTITAGCVVSSSSSSSSSTTSGSKVSVARAVAVLDGSLVAGDSSLLFVIPPNTLGPWQSAVVRGLQLGHALTVAPPGHYLLYLSAVLTQHHDVQCSARATDTAATGGAADAGSSFSMRTAAEQMLGPALAAVAAVQHLQQLAMPQEQSTSKGQQQQQQQSDQSEGAAPAVGRKPQVLAATFFTTQQNLPQAGDLQQQQQPPKLADMQTGSCLVQCPQAPAAGFAGYTSSISYAEALFRQQFPDLPWLTDLQQQQGQQPAAGGAAAEGAAEGAEGITDNSTATAAAVAGSAAAGGMDVDELDAIDELTAALMELSPGLENMPGQGGSAATQL